MNIVDLLLGAILIFSAGSGFQRGFIQGVTNLLSWVAALLIGFALFEKAAALVARLFPALGTWAAPLALLLSVMLAHIALSLLFGALLRHVRPEAHQSSVNKWLGVLPGLAGGWITATMLAVLLSVLPMEGLLTNAVRGSKLAILLSGQAARLENAFAPGIRNLLDKAVVPFPAAPGNDKAVDLPFTVKEPKPRPALEQQMLDLINKERSKEGLKPLRFDSLLLPVARAHSRDMFAKGYFSHVNKEGKTPSGRIRAAGVPFRTAGENLAIGPTLNQCHKGLMASPGHRANILNPAFGRVGIGILDGGFYGLMITQNFRN